MRIEDFDFQLPEAQIAQAPLAARDASRLMVVDRKSGQVAHRTFRDLPSLLRPGDLVVVNDAKVVPARLLGHKQSTGGKVELLVVRPAAEQRTSEALAGAVEATEWLCLGQASKGLKAGARLTFEGGLRAEVLAALGEGELRVRFEADEGSSLGEALERWGKLPLPSYIDRTPTREDLARYQTVYARASGSVAAPTAGLHFTPELFAELEARGIGCAQITLDVGPGTFLPVRETEIEKHRMHPERFEVPAQTVEAVRATRARGGKIVAIGTTVVRALEAASQTGELLAGPAQTSIFLRPGVVFRQVDALVTNFHLPRSTLLMLVSAFLGTAPTLAAYSEAVSRGYRFFSYGDAMLISEGAI